VAKTKEEKAIAKKEYRIANKEKISAKNAEYRIKNKEKISANRKKIVRKEKVIEITHDYLKECIDYNKDTGIFIWKKRPLHHFASERGFNTWNSKYCGKVASSNRKGYLVIGIYYGQYFAHRLAWFYIHGVMPDKQIDHINGITDDNRMVNLRLANHAENQQNQRRCAKNNKTGFLGVSFKKSHNKFQAVIGIDKKLKHLGYFETPELASNAYILAKRRLHEFGVI